MFEEREATGDPGLDAFAPVPEPLPAAGPAVPEPVPVGVPVVLPAAVRALQDAVAGLAGWDPAGLDGATALASTGVLLECERALAAARTRSLSDVEARRLHRLEDAPSTGRRLTRQGHHLPARQLTLARRLAVLPRLADALAAGQVSPVVAQHLQAALTSLRPHLDRPDGLIDGQDASQALTGVIVNGVRTMVCQARGGFPSDDDAELVALVSELEQVLMAPETQLARVEAALLVLAAQLTGCGATGELPGALRQLLDALLPAQLEARARRGEDTRGLHLTKKSDGSGWRVNGDLDLETGELAHTVLSAEARRDEGNPTDTDRAAALRQLGLEPHDDGLRLPDSRRPRSRREQLHDALKAALRRSLSADLGGVHDKAPVRLLVTVPAAALDHQPGALPAVGPTGMPLPVSLIRRWACTSTLTRLVLSLAGKAIEVSHTERTLKPHQRRALHTQTAGTCQSIGCTRSTRQPGAVLHPHHADPWAATGTTSLSDTVLLCDNDHADLHHSHTLALKNGRRLGPDGWLT